jgi:flagellar biosynthesis/type III secretory pathway protein FliH
LNPPPAAQKAPKHELIVQVININLGKNNGIITKCRELEGYSLWVDKVRKLEKKLKKEYPDLESDDIGNRAVAGAIEYCKARDILKEYWESLTMEEIKMLVTDWMLEDTIELEKEAARDEGREEGLKEGRKEGRKELLELLRKGYTLEQVEKMLENRETSTKTAGK